MPVESLYRPTYPRRPFLLAADIDGTLLGDEAGQLELMALVNTHRASFKLAYVTGRYEWSVLHIIEEGFLPRPDYIFSDVGTDLLDLSDPSNRLGQKYAARVGSEWDLETIYRLGEGEGIRRQDFKDAQPRFQAGFDWDGDPRTLEAFRARLAALHQSHILPSYGEYIDVLPNPLGKGKAVEFLQEELGIPEDLVVVAGDSGNDREMLETRFRGIVPANALEELKSAASAERHYHSPLPAARGVLDGLCHFGFLERVDTVPS